MALAYSEWDDDASFWHGTFLTNRIRENVDFEARFIRTFWAASLWKGEERSHIHVRDVTLHFFFPNGHCLLDVVTVPNFHEETLLIVSAVFRDRSNLHSEQLKSKFAPERCESFPIGIAF